MAGVLSDLSRVLFFNHGQAKESFESTKAFQSVLQSFQAQIFKDLEKEKEDTTSFLQHARHHFEALVQDLGSKLSTSFKRTNQELESLRSVSGPMNLWTR